MACAAQPCACDDRNAPPSAPTRESLRADVRAVPEVFDHVVLVSVDGLRPECLESPLVERLPNFARLLRGPHTLDARTDPTITVTLPNHLSMLTGRPVAGDAGHAWTLNSDPPAARHGGTLHAQKGSYVASMFDVAHDHGVATGAAFSKTKFSLLTQSYGPDAGAADTVGKDNGTGKIDRALYAPAMAEVALGVTSWLGAARGPSLTFAHFAAPDVAGHATGWDLSPSSPYIAAVEEVDRALGAVLDAIERSPSLAGRAKPRRCDQRLELPDPLSRVAGLRSTRSRSQPAEPHAPLRGPWRAGRLGPDTPANPQRRRRKPRPQPPWPARDPGVGLRKCGTVARSRQRIVRCEFSDYLIFVRDLC
jgi:hypothetical protein